MKIGIVTTWYERGAAYVSRQYADVLRDNNDIYIYSRGSKSEIGDEWLGENIHIAKNSFIPITCSIHRKDFINWIVHNKIECIFFNEQQWWPPVLWARELGVKVGAYIDYYTEQTIPLFASYDFLICNTKKHYQAFNWHPQAYYVPWGTDINLFKPTTSTSVEEDKVTFFNSAGYNPHRKGTDLVIKAFSKLSGNAKLIIHTQIDLITVFPEMKNLIEGLIIDGGIQVIKETVTAPGLYHLGDVFVQPSRLEGIGLPAAEALSCGLPFITSNKAPMNEFFTPAAGMLADIEKEYSRSDGYYWPVCEVNIDSLSKCMLFYINNVENLRQYKNNARQHAVDKLNWHSNADKINEHFHHAQILKVDIKQLIWAYEDQRKTFLVVLSQKNAFLGRIGRKLYTVFNIPVK